MSKVMIAMVAIAFGTVVSPAGDQIHVDPKGKDPRAHRVEVDLDTARDLFDRGFAIPEKGDDYALLEREPREDVAPSEGAGGEFEGEKAQVSKPGRRASAAGTAETDAPGGADPDAPPSS